jgi:CubicO group peptidase (beta-lactamase class C family)
MKRVVVIALLAMLISAARSATTEHDVAAGSGHALTVTDLEAYLDGFMPYALTQGDIAGATVAVVANQGVLLERGYGDADVSAREGVDPERTLFRAGSVSKLFTWTAVMQLVEQGQLDLDADINTYLDFRIPPAWGKPITMRNLMTHTAGFEEADKRTFFRSGKTQVSLAEYIKAWTPTRIYPPGEVSAYSNYGAALAGYIVQRVAAESLEDYVARHIFAPLGMTHSTFAQPLPARFTADMSRGYRNASAPPRPFELVGPSPAGALSATAGDMARFMIAHLENGTYGSARILRPDTAVLMHSPAYRSISAPELNAMALGFYREDRNGHRIIGHEGDTELFHSDLHLLLDEHVGLFVSLNSAGKGGAAGAVRFQLLRGFMDRYFPAPAAPSQPTLATAVEHGRQVAGRYQPARRSQSNFPRIVSLLGQAVIQLEPEGTLVGLHDWNGSLKHWHEVAPWVWRQVGGDSILAATIKDGRVMQLVDGDVPAPVGVLLPVPLEYSSRWALPLFVATALALLVITISWPVCVFRLRRSAGAAQRQGRQALMHRLAQFVCLVDLVFLAGWITIVVYALTENLGLLDTPLDPWLLALNALGAIGLGGALVVGYDFALTWRDPSLRRSAQWASLLRLLSCASVVWLALTYRLVTFSVNY